MGETYDQFWKDASKKDASKQDFELREQGISFFTAAYPGIFDKKAEDEAFTNFIKMSNSDDMKIYNAYENLEAVFKGPQLWVAWAVQNIVYENVSIDRRYLKTLRDMGIYINKADIKTIYMAQTRENIEISDRFKDWILFLAQYFFSDPDLNALEFKIRPPVYAAPPPKIPAYPRSDEDTYMSFRKRKDAVNTFMNRVVPAFDDPDGNIRGPGGEIIPKGQWNMKMESIVADFSHGRISIYSLLSFLFNIRPYIKADDEFALILLKNTIKSDIQIYAYLKKHPDTVPEMTASIFGSPQRYALHIQWAYDTFLVPKGFKKQDLFIKNQAAYWPQLGDAMQEEKQQRDVSPIACDACGTTLDNACACAQCGIAMYCGRECQEMDWKTGKHAINCWDTSLRDPDALSQLIVVDMHTRHSEHPNFPHAIGQPLDPLLVESAPVILKGLQTNIPEAIDTAHTWLACARHNHTGTALESLSNVDLLDTMEDLAAAQHMALPTRLEDILDAYDVHATLDVAQREQVSQYVGQMAFDMRDMAPVGNVLEDMRDKYTKWRSTRKQTIGDLKKEKRWLEQELAEVNRKLAKKSWNPLRRYQYRRDAKGAAKRWGR